jgi:hypothetical protein
MCTACGCADRAVTIDAPVRTNTKHVNPPSYVGSSMVGGQELHESDASVINGWNVPAPYGKGK